MTHPRRAWTDAEIEQLRNEYPHPTATAIVVHAESENPRDVAACYGNVGEHMRPNRFARPVGGVFEHAPRVKPPAPQAPVRVGVLVHTCYSQRDGQRKPDDCNCRHEGRISAKEAARRVKAGTHDYQVSIRKNGKPYRTKQVIVATQSVGDILADQLINLAWEKTKDKAKETETKRKKIITKARNVLAQCAGLKKLTDDQIVAYLSTEELNDALDALKDRPIGARKVIAVAADYFLYQHPQLDMAHGLEPTLQFNDWLIDILDVHHGYHEPGDVPAQPARKHKVV